MTIIAVGGVGSRSDDWLFVGIVLATAYIVVYPLLILLRRNQHSRRIKNQLVTSPYKLPIKMNPTEFAYIFSSKINSQHLYATLLELANKSVVVIRQKEGKKYVEPGPKIEDNLTDSESFLVDHIFQANRPLPVDLVITGYSSHKNDNKIINGSRRYVFWWLLRYQLRKRNIIENRMTGRYTKMLLIFGVLSSFIISVVSVGMWSFVQMLEFGELDFGHILEHQLNSLQIWLTLLIPIIIVSFFILRFRGRMLGRLWLLKKTNRHYINQMIAFKEFVRLSNKNKLRFESDELQKESTVHTRPYAIALGFTKEKSITGK